MWRARNARVARIKLRSLQLLAPPRRVPLSQQPREQYNHNGGFGSKTVCTVLTGLARVLLDASNAVARGLRPRVRPPEQRKQPPLDAPRKSPPRCPHRHPHLHSRIQTRACLSRTRSQTRTWMPKARMRMERTFSTRTWTSAYSPATTHCLSDDASSATTRSTKCWIDTLRQTSTMRTTSRP